MPSRTSSATIVVDPDDRGRKGKKMRIRGFENGVWADSTTPTAAPRPKRGPDWELINGSVYTHCGGCGELIREWGAPTATVGHWGFRPNPYFQRYNPRLHAIDDRERVRCVKSRRAAVCVACATQYTARRAELPLTDHAWIPDVIERDR